MRHKFTFEEERELEKYTTKELESFFVNFSNKINESNEIGHSEAPKVQIEVNKILNKKYNIDFIKDDKGEIKKRGFSDNIIEGNSNNVKFTTEDKGQPNLVSIKRMFYHFLEKGDDIYFVTIVHYCKNKKEITTKFVNSLQFVDCFSYNTGTGQIMIDQRKFNLAYTDYLENKRKVKTYDEIKSELFSLYLNQMDKHIQLKLKELNDFKKKYL